MIGKLPTSLVLGGVVFEIRTDYREILNILVAFNDPELTDEEKWKVAIICFYVDYEKIKQEQLEDALSQIAWFINCGKIEEHKKAQKPVYDWEQDEQIIFSAINKVANEEVRNVPYMHWWTFMGYFNEIGEGTFSTIVSIRDKRNKGKKLESYEKEFLRNNHDLVTLKPKLTQEDKDFLEQINQMIGGS